MLEKKKTSGKKSFQFKINKSIQYFATFFENLNKKNYFYGDRESVVWQIRIRYPQSQKFETLALVWQLPITKSVNGNF